MDSWHEQEVVTGNTSNAWCGMGNMDCLATPGPCPFRVQTAKFLESYPDISVHNKDLTRPNDSGLLEEPVLLYAHEYYGVRWVSINPRSLKKRRIHFLEAKHYLLDNSSEQEISLVECSAM